MKAILLKNSRRVTFVDDGVYDRIKQYVWYDNGHGYIYRSWREGKRVYKEALHHAVIGKPPEGLCSDHINGDPFDNRRENLRIVNRRINALNRKQVIQKYGRTWRFKYTTADGLTLRMSGFRTEEEARSVAALIKGALIYEELSHGK
jgi:HNH endonuclease